MKTLFQSLIDESSDVQLIDSLANALFMPRDTEENQLRRQLTLDNTVGYLRHLENEKEKNQNDNTSNNMSAWDINFNLI